MDKKQGYSMNVATSSCNFGPHLACKRQYGQSISREVRDIEIARLKSVENYVNPASVSNDQCVPYLSCRFCPQDSLSQVYAVSDELGNISLHDVHSPQKELVSIKALSNAIFDLRWTPGDTKLLALCGDHSSRLYQIAEAHIALISIFDGHAKSVKTADFVPYEPAVFATGSRDGSVYLYDSRVSSKAGLTIHPDQKIPCAAGPSIKDRSRSTSGSVASVTALAFHNRNSLLVCGSTDELIRIWELRMTFCPSRGSAPKAVKRTSKRGYNDLVLSPDHTIAYASSIGGCISAFNLHSELETPFAEFLGHEASSYYVKTCISPDGEYLASGSTDRAVHVWKTSGAEMDKRKGGRRPMLRLPGHNSEVTGVDMSMSSTLAMVSCAEDGTVRSWLPTSTLMDYEDKTIDQTRTILAELNISEPVVKKPATVHTIQCEKVSETPIVSSTSQLVSPSKPRPKLQNLTPPRRAIRTTEVPPSSGKRKQSEMTPKSDLKRQTLSPMKLDYESPTMNLPNYVEEGTGPRHSCPKVRHKENQNWLTEIRRKSVDKRSASAEKERRRHRPQPGRKCTSRKTLLEYYQKSSKGTDESVKSEAPLPIGV